MIKTFEPFEPDFDEVVTDLDLVGYFSPKSIIDDPEIPVERKRALLAHWASDIHAVAGMPALRHGAGVTTSIDAIKAALGQLDDMLDGAIMTAKSHAGTAAA